MRNITIFCLVLILIGMLGTGVSAEPQLTESFWGSLIMQDGSPIPAPVTVSAVVENGGGYVVTTEDGKYGDYDYTVPRLVVGGLGIPNDAPISFFIDGVPVECNDNQGGGWRATYPFDSGTNVNLDLRLTGPVHTISASAGPHGTINPAGEVVVPEGMNRTFTIVPDSCYDVVNVLVDDVPQGAISVYKFTDVMEDHTIEALFEQNTLVISAFASSGGTISPSGDTVVPCGGSQSYTINPQSPCYQVADVLVDDVSVGAVRGYTFSDVVTDHEIEAIFEPVNTTIFASAGDGGTISPAGATVVPCGGNQIYTFNPFPCSGVGTIIIDGVSFGPMPSYTFINVTAPHTISVTFTSGTLTINATPGPGGNIEPSGLIPVSCGGNRTFTINPGGCSQVGDVLVDGISVGAVRSYTFTNVTTDRTISAVFTFSSSTITASAGQGGTITPQGAVSVPCGGNQTFEIAPDSCHSIANVMVDGESVGAVLSYEFTNVTEDHQISASFVVNTYPITTLPGPNGDIFPPGTVNVPCGTNVTFFFMPDSGYHVQDVAVDGVSIGSPASYAFNQVTGPHNISATFAVGGPIYFTSMLQWSEDDPWNLFSTPVSLDNGKDTLVDIFPHEEDIDVVLGWDGQKWFQPGPDYVLNPLYALYIRVNDNTPALLYPAQYVTAPPSRPLPSGISLLGPAPAYDELPAMFPAQRLDLALISIKEAPGNLTGYTMVISPALNQPGWAYALGGDLEDLLPFKGYWVVMTNPDTLFGFSTTPIL